MRFFWGVLALAAALYCVATVTADDWNMGIATDLSRLDAIAYCPDQDIEGWQCVSCSPGLTFRQLFVAPDTTVSAYVVDNNDNTTIVVFKGTDPLSWTEWAEDAKLLMQHTPEICDSCYVHSGFYQSYQSLRDAMFANMMTSLNNLPADSGSRKVYVTGHSLGAATATLFALYLKQQQGIDSVVYTFGTPRIGNRDYANTYNSLMPNSFRFIHHADIVPHLPPALLGYYHEGLLIYCPDDQGVQCQAMPGAEDDGGFLHISVTDHGQYCGINFFDYIDLGSQKGCKPSS